MEYISTRANYRPVMGAEAIYTGMVPTGGLFVPEKIPRLQLNEIEKWVEKSYSELALEILHLYLPDFSREELSEIVSQSYGANFDHPEIAPVVKIDQNFYIMELWHGPTAAFKDMALQLMPRLLVKAREKVGAKREIVILVATSGDTGKAALEGFRDVPGTRIIVFYPRGGVSKVQELQMTTTGGSNTHVVAVEGNFDDCQTGVKNIFANSSLRKFLQEKGFELSSANSINWGRLLPQIIYYFWAYLKLRQRQEIAAGEKINFVVPTGNFGNILAAYYAREMGLPVGKLVCASNINKVLTDFFRTGVYDRRREFYRTISPSMDILISSNLERFLFEITGRDGEQIAAWFTSLVQEGIFQVGQEIKNKMAEVVYADFATEEETLAVINETWQKYRYLADPHTAVGIKVFWGYRRETGDTTPTVVDATASPFKFGTSVLTALLGKELASDDEFAILRELATMTGWSLPPGLAGLEERPVRHHRVCRKEEMEKTVLEILGGQ
ncbi:MAG: threonine synthase [Eubacteriales bacterium]|nr:threonine synthase [Eubacteriales bacterium]